MVAVFAAEGEDNLPATVKKSHSTPMLSRSAHYFSNFVPRDYRDQLLDYLSYRAPVTMNGPAIDQVSTNEATGKTDATLDKPGKVDKQTLNNSMELLNDEKVE